MKHEPATVGRKVCKTCKESKSVLAFAASPSCIDGLQPECRQCVGERRDRSQIRQRHKEAGIIKPPKAYRW